MRIVTLLICWSLLVVGAARADEALTLDQILARHQNALARMQRCRMSSSEHWTNTRADGDSQAGSSTRMCDVRADGDRVNLLVREETLDPDPSNQHSNEFNYLRDGHVLRIYFPHEKFRQRQAKASAINGRLSKESDDEMFVHSVLGGAAVAFGVTTFPNLIPVSKLVSSSQDARITKDEFGYCVSGAAKDGTRHMVWFDPAASFLVTRMRFEQTGATLNENRFQYNRRILSARHGISEKSIVNSVVFEVRGVKFAPWKDTHVLTNLETLKTISTSDGAKATEHMVYALTDWNLDPDFSDESSFKPMLPVPEGSRVFIEETPSLEYAYINGKIELAVNEALVGELEHVPMVANRPATSRMQWVWGAVSTILGLVWWRIRSSSG